MVEENRIRWEKLRCTREEDKGKSWKELRRDREKKGNRGRSGGRRKERGRRLGVKGKQRK